MALTLHSLRPGKGSKQRKQRVGRGLARKGTTSGRGMKGQRARSGGKSGLKLKGLRQTLLRVPKVRGFKSGKPEAVAVNLKQLEGLKGDVVSPKTLQASGIIDAGTKLVKILAVGEVTTAYKVHGCKISAAAKAKIEAAGGSVA